MIIRVEHRKQFTVITDQALRDPEISFRATGILAYLLSLPDGTEISGLKIQHAKKEGRDAVYAALKELETAGYLRRQRLRDSTGRWFWGNVLIEQRPGKPQPLPGFQETVNQESVFQESKALIPTTNTYRDTSLENRLGIPDVPVAKGLASMIRQEHGWAKADGDEVAS